MAAPTPPPRPPRACARCSARRCAPAAPSSPSRARARTSRSRSGSPPRTGRLLAAVPVAAALRADPDIVSEREWLLTAAVVGTLVELAEPGALTRPDDLRLRAGELPGGYLVLAYPATGFEADFVELAFEEQAHAIDRLRAHGAARSRRA